MKDEKELMDAVCGMVRYGYNTAVLELCDWIQQGERSPGELHEKLIEMLETKKELNREQLIKEIYEQTN